MDIYDAFAQNTSAVSQISRADNGRLNQIEFNSKSESVEFEGETYEASEVIDQLRNSEQFEETSFQSFKRTSLVSSESEGAGTGLIISGYVLGFLLPIVGFIIGIVTMTKGSSGHGAGHIGLSIIAWLFWMATMM